MSRLVSLDNTLPYKGPKLYNYIINKVNKENVQSPNNIKLERKFLNSFKASIFGYLADLQDLGGMEWEPQNLTLYSV